MPCISRSDHLTGRGKGLLRKDYAISFNEREDIAGDYRDFMPGMPVFLCGEAGGLQLINRFFVSH